MVTNIQAPLISYNPDGPTAAETANVSARLVRLHPLEVLTAAEQGHGPAALLHALLRYLDTPGSGRVPLDVAQAALCDRRSPTFYYGRRRLSAVLDAGEGRYWTRSKQAGQVNIYLHGRGRILAQLGITLSGREALLPVADVLQPNIEHGRARYAASLAAVYSAAHLGRKHDNPMSRASVSNWTHLSRGRQLRYETRRAIGRQTAWEYVEHTPHKMAWATRQYGGAVYRHVDYRGRLGRPGHVYIARRIGSRFTVAPGQTAAVKSRRNLRRMNAIANRLRTHIGRGNDELSPRVYFATSKTAGKAATREAGRSDARPAYAPIATRGPVAVAAYVDYSGALDSRYAADMRAAAQAIEGGRMARQWAL